MATSYSPRRRKIIELMISIGKIIVALSYSEKEEDAIPRFSRRRERMAPLCLSRRTERLGIHPFSNEGEGLSRKRREKRRDARARRLPPVCLLRRKREEGHPLLL